MNGVHVAVGSYANVHGQWTQCRKYSEECRLINVTNDCGFFKHSLNRIDFRYKLQI